MPWPWRRGEVRYLGEFDNTSDGVTKLVRKLAERYETVQFCYEGGPTGYGVYRQILALGQSCILAIRQKMRRNAAFL